MPTRNIYRSKLNEEIHKLIEESSAASNEEIKIYLQGKYSESEIHYYLDYRYQEKYLQKLNYPLGKPPLWLKYIFMLCIGVGLLSIHYLWMNQIDFQGNDEKLNHYSPGRSMWFAAFFGIGYYGSFCTGITLLIAPIIHLAYTNFIKNNDD